MRVWLVAGLVVATVMTVALISSFGRDPWLTSCTGPLAPPTRATGSAGEVRTALSGATVGYEVLDLSGCAVVAGLNGQQRFASASVVKLLIALDVLSREGDTAEDDLSRMLSTSDDTVASQLWQRHGGPQIVRRVAERLHLADTAPPARSGQWGDTQITAHDVALVYRHISALADRSQRMLLTAAMADAPRQAADGFDQHFGIPDGLPGARWAVKQGWGSSEGRQVLHTTGLVGTRRQYAVVLLTSWPGSTDRVTASRALTGAARQVREPGAR